MKREVEQKQERTACQCFAQSIEKKLAKPLYTCAFDALASLCREP
jgi:hypothetical protein